MNGVRKTIFILGRFLLSLSESIYDFVFAVLALQVGGNSVALGYSYAIGYFGEVVVSLFSGGFLDHYSKGKIIILSLALKCVVFSVFLIIHKSNGQTTSVVQILLFAFFADVVHHFGRIATDVSIWSLFEQKEGQQVLAWGSALGGTVRVLSPAAGGAMIGYGTLKPENFLILCTVLQIVAAFCLVPLYKRIPAPEKCNKTKYHLFNLRCRQASCY